MSDTERARPSGASFPVIVLPAPVEHALYFVERRLLVTVAAHPHLTTFLPGERDELLALFSPAHETREVAARLAQVLEDVEEHEEDEDEWAALVATAARPLVEALEAPLPPPARERFQPDLRALRVARDARAALASADEWRQRVEAAALSWGGAVDDAESFERSFPTLGLLYGELAFEHADALMKPCLTLAEADFRERVLTTGMPALDDATGGLAPGRLWLLTGKEGTGKSTLLLQMALAASQAGKPVAVLSLADSALATLDRLVGLARGVRPSAMARLRDRGLSTETWIALAEGSGEVGLAPLWLASAPPLTPAEIARAMADVVARHEVRVLFVDGACPRDWRWHSRELWSLRDAAQRLGIALVMAVEGEAYVHRDARPVADVELELRAHEDGGTRVKRGSLEITHNAYGRRAAFELRRGMRAPGFDDVFVTKEEEEEHILRSFVTGTLDIEGETRFGDDSGFDGVDEY